MSVFLSLPLFGTMLVVAGLFAEAARQDKKLKREAIVGGIAISIMGVCLYFLSIWEYTG